MSALGACVEIGAAITVTFNRQNSIAMNLLGKALWLLSARIVTSGGLRLVLALIVAEQTAHNYLFESAVDMQG